MVMRVSEWEGLKVYKQFYNYADFLGRVAWSENNLMSITLHRHLPPRHVKLSTFNNIVDINFIFINEFNIQIIKRGVQNSL